MEVYNDQYPRWTFISHLLLIWSQRAFHIYSHRLRIFASLCSSSCCRTRTCLFQSQYILSRLESLKTLFYVISIGCYRMHPSQTELVDTKCSPTNLGSFIFFFLAHFSIEEGLKFIYKALTVAYFKISLEGAPSLLYFMLTLTWRTGNWRRKRILSTLSYSFRGVR